MLNVANFTSTIEWIIEGALRLKKLFFTLPLFCAKCSTKNH